MRSKRSLESYLLIDNRVSGGPSLESAVLTCSHCHTQMILNPDRSRPREYCQKCDKYVCDGCKAGGECTPLNARFDWLQNEALKEKHGPLVC